MKRLSLLIPLIFLLNGSVFAQNMQKISGNQFYPYLQGEGLQDNALVFKDKLFFTGSSSSGMEMLQSDGTIAGTKLFKDLVAGSANSRPTQYTLINPNLMMFMAKNGAGNCQLYKTDGTVAGTSVVKSLTIRCDYVPVTDFAASNGLLFFSASDGINGFELWKSDGTAAGTVMVKDISPATGNTFSYTYQLTDFTDINGILYFNANDGVHGQELWKSDGTAAGTVMIKDLNPGTAGSSPGEFVHINGTTFFVAYTENEGLELWKTDGTAAGTVLVKDIRDFSDSGFPQNMVNFNGTLYFSANDGINGIELWKSDGTEAGTVMVKDIETGSSSSEPQQMTVVGNKLYFSASTAALGREFYLSDGTTAGTKLIMDLNPGTGSSGPNLFTDIGGKAYFSANGVLYKSNGTEEGTVQLLGTCQTIGYIIPYKDGIFVAAYDGPSASDYSLFYSDICPPTTATPVNMTAAADLKICFNTPTTLKVSNIGDISWYNSATGGAKLGEGKSFNTGYLKQTTTFYAQDSICFASNRLAITVTVNPEIISSLVSKTDVKCNGSLTGAATIMASGGTAPLTYTWSPNVGTTTSISGVAAGNYSCLIKDANNCLDTVTFIIATPPPFNVSLASQINVLCYGNKTGSATIEATGGVSPYTYSWTNGGGTTANLSGKGAGTYICTVKDANDCQKTQSVTITQPEVLFGSVTSKTDVLCHGAATGAATVSVTGGTAPYSYSWSGNNGTTKNLVNVTAGTYTCTITDKNNCVITKEVVLTEPASGIEGTISSQNNVICYGETNGSATISVTGGTAPYTYSWSSGETSTSISNKPAGTYTCTIKDAKQCTENLPVEITQPPYISRGITVSLGGSKFVAHEEGAEYQWINCANNTEIPGANKRTFVTTATSGSFKVRITKNGCTVETDCVDMAEVGVEENENQLITVYPNPNSGEFYLQVPLNTKITISTLLGQIIHVITTEKELEQIHLKGVSTGVYNIRAITAEGKVYNKELVIQ